MNHLKPFVIIAIALAIILSGGWFLAVSLQVRAPLQHADAIVVLSGSEGYLERTKLAATLFHQGRARLVILTNDNQQGGWSDVEQRNPFFVERELEQLVISGVPKDCIEVLKDPVSSTYDEAILLRSYATERKSRALIFVTSPYHSRRAFWILRHVFRGTRTDIGLEAPNPGEQSPYAYRWWASTSGWHQVAFEYPKLLYYRLRYH